MTCVLCAVKGRSVRHDWPMTEVAGHPVHRACEYELAWVLRSFPTDARKDGQVWRWQSNGSCLMDDTMRVAGRLGLATNAEIAATAAVREVETAAFLAEYRRQARPLTGEALLEARAAFGPGATVVDIVSGVETQL